MSQYKNFKYGGAKYGATSATSPRWGFVVDWDDDGNYDSTNEAQYMTGLIVERGREYFIASSNDGFEPLSIGRATVTLTNHNGRYNPYNTSSPLYPNIDVGKFAQISVRYGLVVYPVFTGIIRDIQMSGLNDQVTMILEDGFSWLVQAVQTALYQSIQAPSAITTLLDASKWPTFWPRDLGSGSDLYYYWWADGTSILDEMRRLLDSELSTYCIRADGTFYYRNRQIVGSSVLSLTEAQLRKDVKIPLPWEFRRNIVKFTGNPTTVQPQSEIWASSTDIVIPAGGSQTITAEFNTPITSAITPVANTDYIAWDQSGGVGNNITSDISVSLVQTLPKSVTITLTNNGSVLAFVNTLHLRGYELVSSSVSSTATGTGATTRPRSLEVVLDWNQNPNAPADFASQIMLFLNTSSAFPSIQIDNRPDIQFTPDIYDIITVDLSSIGINTTFRVGKIKHEWIDTENGQATRTTWNLEPYRNYTYWLFDSNAVLNTSLLGW